MKPGLTLIHVRHGQTDWNVAGRLQGQLDIPMNDHGRAQAARNGRALAGYLSHNGPPAAALHAVSSPLGRSVETMTIVQTMLGLPDAVPRDDRLKEVDFGEWSGHTYDELASAGQRELVERRRRDKWSFRPPGGETYAELAERVGDWLDTLTGDTLAVTHGGVYRVLCGHLCGTPWHEVPSLPAPQDRFAVFADGRLTLM